jgi:hypothetical protein
LEEKAQSSIEAQAFLTQELSRSTANVKGQIEKLREAIEDWKHMQLVKECKLCSHVHIYINVLVHLCRCTNAPI